MIALKSLILVLIDGVWSVGYTASFKKDDGSIDIVINGKITNFKKGCWQSLPVTYSERQAEAEVVNFNIRSLISSSVVRASRSKKEKIEGELPAVVIDDIFDNDYEEETYSDDCDCDSCRASRGEEI